YSGRLIEPDPEEGTMMRLTHDAEQSSAGFWLGDESLPEPIFFAYTWPKPDGVEEAVVEPSEAYWNTQFGGEFVLPYAAVQGAGDPRRTLLEFLESTYRAGASRAGWAEELVS